MRRTRASLLVLALLCLLAPATTWAADPQQQQQRLQQQHEYQPRLLHYGSSVAPVLTNYSFAGARDTFSLCREQSGVPDGHDVSNDDLLQQFRLPRDLNKHKHLTLPQLAELLHSVQPAFKVVFQPMLSGEADIRRLVDPDTPTNAAHSLPKLVHFTVKDKNRLRPHQVLAMASWAYYNPGYSLMLFDDADIRAFMTTYYPDLLATFDGLGSPVERTDLWRYLVLCRLGGVYADSDVMAARPISQWAQDAGLLVGIENVFTTPEEARRRSYSRQVQMVQWSIASRPGHPVVCRMGQYVAKHVAEERAGEFLDPDRNHAILERTGPGIWSDSVHDYLRQVGNVSVEQLVGGGRVGDVRILPQPAFGCPTAVFDTADPLPYVYHMFMGSWKVSQPSAGGLKVFIRKLSSSLHRTQQLKEGAPAAGAGGNAGSTAGAAAAAAGSRASSLPIKHPRRPILEEQIMQHESLQRQAKQQQLLLLQQQEAQQLKSKQASPQPRSGDQPAAAAAPVNPQAAAAEQQKEQGRPQDPAAAAASKLSTRKLRATQVQLVRPVTAVPVPNTVHGLLLEPELPSRIAGGIPMLSLLVVAALLVALYRRQQRSTAGVSAGLWATARNGIRAARSAVGLPPRSPLTRPHSRAHLSFTGPGGNALLVCTGQLPQSSAAGAGAGVAGSGGSSKGSLSILQEAVCYSSSQHAARGGHGHKRSWGSASFQL